MPNKEKIDTEWARMFSQLIHDMLGTGVIVKDA